MLHEKMQHLFDKCKTYANHMSIALSSMFHVCLNIHSAKNVLKRAFL